MKRRRFPQTVCLLIMPEFKHGDPPPKGYLQWHEWARVQYAHGSRQRQCASCDLWKFPPELPCRCRDTLVGKKTGFSWPLETETTG